MGYCVYLDETCRVPRHKITHSCKSDGAGDGTSISLLNISLKKVLWYSDLFGMPLV